MPESSQPNLLFMSLNQYLKPLQLVNLLLKRILGREIFQGIFWFIEPLHDSLKGTFVICPLDQSLFNAVFHVGQGAGVSSQFVSTKKRFWYQIVVVEYLFVLCENNLTIKINYFNPFTTKLEITKVNKSECHSERVK